jgi:polyisoprenoid-binding protein YceI
MVKAATTLRSQINDAKAKKNQREVEWFEGRLELLIGGQRDEVRAMAGELQRLGYAIDPSKTSLGLTGAQQFFAELVGVFTGAEDGVKDTPEYRTLHQLYASMPNDLSEQQLKELGGVASRLQEFNSTVREINDRRVRISTARANNNPGEVRRLEQEIEGLTATQRTAVNGMVGELQRLNYQIDPSKTSIGLTGAQRLYADIVGVLTGVEDVVKEIPEFKELHELYMSMPNQLSDQQLQDLAPVWDRLEKFPDTVKAITTLRRQINDAKANKNQREVDWYESRIQLVIESQRSGVRALVADLKRLNYTIDPDKISLGLTGTQQFYADIVGVLQAAEDDVKAMDEYKLFHQLYLSMPNQLTDQQLRDLAGVKDRMAAFADAAKTINKARVQINVARTAKDEGSVRFYEQQIASETARQRTELQAMVRGLQGLNYQVDPNKTSLGLTGTQRFYADLVGVLMGVEDEVKEIPEYRTLHQLYASMPSQLSDRQLRDLQGVWDRMGRFQESVKEVASVRKEITEAKAKKNQGEVKRLEGRLAQLVGAQRDDVRALAADLQRLNYTIDESKTSLGLTGSQQFYNDLSGILTMAETEVKETPAYQTLSRLYASMPSELSDQQLRQLRGLWAQIRGVDPISDQINALRVLLVQEKAKANA